VTVFDSVGFALEDYAAVCFMRDTAVELGLGETIELLPRAADPKDLFGVLRHPTHATAATTA
jgi:ornithine cyclodeaminase